MTSFSPDRRLRGMLAAPRADDGDVDGQARARLAVDEAAATGRRPSDFRLAEAGREFWRHPSPWLVGTLLVAALTARIIIGDWRVSDAVTPLVMLAVFPFFEWVVHVCVLHWRPRTVAGRLIDPQLSRKHRAHHADPRNIPLVFIPWPRLARILPAITLIALLAFPRPGVGLTFLTGVGVLGLGYEWVHYLIHSDYRPRTRVYRAVWRNHRLHHYKNEHYWFTVTSAGIADRVLGTYPDPQAVPSSPTVKNLY